MIELRFPDIPVSLHDSLDAFPYGGEQSLPEPYEAGFRRLGTKLEQEGFQPHAIYFVTPEILEEGNVTEDAVFFGWRSVLAGVGNGDLAALIRSIDSPEAEGFVELNIGRYVDGSFAAFQQLLRGEIEGVPESGSFEFRILIAPSICQFAIWLYNEGEWGDYFVVHPPTPDPVDDVFVVFPEEEFGLRSAKLQHIRNNLRNTRPTDGFQFGAM